MSTHPPMLSPTFPGRFSLPALPLLLGNLPSVWSPSFPLYAPTLIPLFFLDSLPAYDLDRWLCLFSFWQRQLWQLHTCGTTVTLSFSAGPVCSSFSAEAWTILQTLWWFWQCQQVYRFSSPLFSFYPLLHLSFYLKLSGRNCLFCHPLLLGYNESLDTHFCWE